MCREGSLNRINTVNCIMATTERGVFLHWKKVEPLSKTKKQLSNRGGCEGVRTTQSTDRKGGVTDKKQDSEVLVGVAKTDTGQCYVGDWQVVISLCYTLSSLCN